LLRINLPASRQDTKMTGEKSMSFKRTFYFLSIIDYFQVSISEK